MQSEGRFVLSLRCRVIYDLTLLRIHKGQLSPDASFVHHIQSESRALDKVCHSRYCCLVPMRTSRIVQTLASAFIIGTDYSEAPSTPIGEVTIDSEALIEHRAWPRSFGVNL